MDWRDEAACHGMDTNLFYPADDKGQTIADVVTPEAEAACLGCPVAAECGAYADSLGTRDGIWAGRNYRVSANAAKRARTRARRDASAAA